MEWQPIGRHRFRREGIVFVLETRGEMTPADAGQVIDEMSACDRQDPRLGVLVDVRGGFSISAEARRTLALRSEAEKHRPAMPLAILGASLPVRALVTLLINAVGLIRRRRQMELTFCASEAEALSWMEPLIEKRMELLTALAQAQGSPASSRSARDL